MGGGREWEAELTGRFILQPLIASLPPFSPFPPLQVCGPIMREQDEEVFSVARNNYQLCFPPSLPHPALSHPVITPRRRTLSATPTGGLSFLLRQKV